MCSSLSASFGVSALLSVQVRFGTGMLGTRGSSEMTQTFSAFGSSH